MLNPIVVPLDGSELAERALAPARALAQYSQAELLLVRAASRPLFVTADVGYGVLYPEPSRVEARQAAEQYLAGLKAAYAGDARTLPVEAGEGDVAGAIVDAARQAQARMIILSSHGYSGVKRWLLGSVAEKVLNAAPCPVWVVRAPMPMRHMLITLDGSRLAEEVLLPARAVARCLGAQVTLLRVVPEMSGAAVEALNDCERGLGRRFADETLEEAAAYLTQVADRCRADDWEPHTAVRSGPAADTILEYAERNAVDLVAMTTHGRTGLRRWIYGSVTHKVLDQLPVSMLVARSAEASLG